MIRLVSLKNMSKYFSLFTQLAKGLLLVPLVFFSSCSEVPRFVIHDGRFFEYSIGPPDVSGLKIVSRDEIHQYIDECDIEAAREYLREMETMSFAGSFIYIAVNAELVDIRSASGITVSNAMLKKSGDPGLWVYVIDGDPSVPIKATSKRLPRGSAP